MVRVFTVLLSLCLAIGSISANAEIITFVVRGVVTGFDGPQINPFAIGQDYEATFTFESETLGSPIIGGGTSYPAILSAQFVIGGYAGTLASPSNGDISVTLRGTTAQTYEYSTRLAEVTGPPILSPAGETIPPLELLLIGLVRLPSVDPPPPQTEDLPIAPLLLENFSQNNWSLTFQSQDFLGAVRGTVTSFEKVEPTIGIPIDIKPGSDPNCFNINGHGVIPVAILGDAALDVTTVDVDSLLFGGLQVRQRKGRALCSVEDVNDDEYWDLVCKFEDVLEDWVADEDEATLTGQLYDETVVEGTDSICLAP